MQSKNMLHVCIFGRSKAGLLGPNILDGEFHTFTSKSEMNKALTKMGAELHDHDVLRGQAFFKLPDGRAGIIIKGERWIVKENNRHEKTKGKPQWLQ